ncbi:MAG: SDR family NAD(P)-dependent oxidoreductase [Candidatus Marinimicrobia bacterium]|nr:SDR family NAD(P)-dependent oxidoreductase [Candidatus Neomarinimicrobiota bacterium]MCF7902625.1 SDR family NAD(P)-dependent oxidoreductase [Candidatus Neomarinimicrobiota bacterium]
MSHYQKILITGASTGLGKQLALEFARRDKAQIWLLARSADKLKAVADEIQSLGGIGHPIPCDVTRPDDLQVACEQIWSESGGVDLMVANAGWSGNMRYPGERNWSTARTVIDLNLRGAILTLEFFTRKMIEQGHGHLVGISSVAGFRGLPKSSVYSATKAGLITYLEALRISVSGYGLFVTDIRPGFVKTPLTDNNHFPMPFLLELEDAGNRMYRAIIRRRKRFTFPKRMALTGWLLRHIPNFLFDWIGAKAARPFNKRTFSGES